MGHEYHPSFRRDSSMSVSMSISKSDVLALLTSDRFLIE